MSAKTVDFNIVARKKLLKGAQTLARVTAVTYGPKGRTVMMDRAAGLMSTKDGVTVAREVVLEDHVENMGAQTLKEACIKVNDQVGDGTTTVAILAAVLLEECHRMVIAGYDPMKLAEGVKAAAVRACEIVDDMAIRVENQKELERVAYVASNGDEEVSKALSEACMAVGKDGTISIEDGQGIDIKLIYKDGMEIPKGTVSLGFLREHGGIERTIEGPLVAVIGSRLAAIEDVQALLEEASQWKDHPLIVFAESIEGAALTTMLMNDAQKVVHSIAVPAPGFGPKRMDHLKDLAAISGATFIDPAAGFDIHKGFDPDWFGGLRKATIGTKTSTLIAHDEAREVIAERIEELKREGAYLDSDYDRDQMSERIARLAGGLCIMQVGGPTEMALKERRARVEDALGSVRSALEGGVVPGAGSVYLAVAEYFPRENDDTEANYGWRVLSKALLAPLRQLANNAGHDGNSIVHQLLELRCSEDTEWLGWDVMEERFRDLGEDPPIIDPAGVAKSVITAAASVTATLLTAEVSIAEA